jgi:hypothetical protein
MALHVRWGGGVAVGLLLAIGAGSPHAADADLEPVLARVAARVAEYFERAQTVVATETVLIQPLNADILPARAFHRRLVYELRVAWGPPSTPGRDPEASVFRRLLTADGRPARASDQPRCLDLPAVSPEPLTMLLPEHRDEYVFTLGANRRTDGRLARTIDFRSAKVGAVEAKWKDDCVSWSADRTRGRIWVDPSSDEVLRMDQNLATMVDLPVPRERERGGYSALLVERYDSSIRYKPVSFHDPDETLLLPASIEILSVSRGPASSTIRTYQTFSEYKRFIGDSRLVEEPR